MKTPSKITPIELVQMVVGFLDAHTHTVPDGYQCKICGTLLEAQDVRFSLHAEEFGDHRAGGGRVQILAVPFCPNCEPEPALSGCLHVPLSEATPSVCTREHLQ